jgi:hypothetical protein
VVDLRYLSVGDVDPSLASCRQPGVVGHQQQRGASAGAQLE